MTVTAVVGNPKPRSRTFHAAELVAERLTGKLPDETIDLADYGPSLFDRADPKVSAAAATVKNSDLVIFASPTYKGSYTGLLKLFLDRFDADELFGVTAVALMLGGDLRHSLAPELLLKPILVEIGATCPSRGLFLVDSAYAEPGALDGWAALAERQVAATSGRLLRSRSTPAPHPCVSACSYQDSNSPLLDVGATPDQGSNPTKVLAAWRAWYRAHV